MAVDFTFRRIEKKYLLTEEKYNQLIEKLKKHMQLDEYGLHTICNIYFDTDSFELIRNSIEKPPYKEKLRLRSYGIPGGDDRVFLEIKKKWKGVVYKRRIALPLKEAKEYLEQNKPLKRDGQIEREIDYFVQFYQPQPKFYIAYDREAYFDREDLSLRITFDRNIRSREDRLQLEAGDDGEALLESDIRLMEIKTGTALPLWLAAALSEFEIYPESFSKYGNIYRNKVSSQFVMLHDEQKVYYANRKEGMKLCLQVF